MFRNLTLAALPLFTLTFAACATTEPDELAGEAETEASVDGKSDSINGASTYFAIRVTLESMPPFRMAALRLALAGGILMGVGWLRGTRLPTRAEWFACSAIGHRAFGGRCSRRFRCIHAHDVAHGPSSAD